MADMYQPVACHVHDEFEAAIMRGRNVRVEIFDQGEWYSSSALLLDTLTRDGEEFLVYSIEGESGQRTVRLDRVRLVE